MTQIERMYMLLLECDNKFPIDVITLAEIKKDYAAKLSRWQQQEQTLNIGIMGQVKAGKSTFLNALLFDGRPILPEAATPKTANLTKVVYGERHSLQVEYYSQQEWDEIVGQANQAGEGDASKVARELVAMGQASGIDLAQHWQIMGGEEHCDTFYADDVAGLQGLLVTVHREDVDNNSSGSG